MLRQLLLAALLCLGVAGSEAHELGLSLHLGDVAAASGNHNPFVFNWSNNSSGIVSPTAATSTSVGVTNTVGTDGTIALNDLLVAVVVVTNGATTDPGAISLAAGTGATWNKVYDTFVGSQTRTAVFWKLANGTEPASGTGWTASWTNSNKFGWAVADFGGAKTSGTLDTSASNAAVGFTPAMPQASISPTNAGDLYVGIWGQLGAQNTYAEDSLLTYAVDNQANSSLIPYVALGYKILSASGAAFSPSQPTVTQAFGNNDWSTFAMAFVHK